MVKGLIKTYELKHPRLPVTFQIRLESGNGSISLKSSPIDATLTFGQIVYFSQIGNGSANISQQSGKISKDAVFI